MANCLRSILRYRVAKKIRTGQNRAEQTRQGERTERNGKGNMIGNSIRREQEHKNKNRNTRTERNLGVNKKRKKEKPKRRKQRGT